MLRVVFPQDGMSQDKRGRDIPLPLCPRTKKFSCPGVPLSRDKGKSKCPGTSQDKITLPKEHKKQEKYVLKQEKDIIKQEKDVLKQERMC